MTSSYQQQSNDAIKTAIKYDTAESDARQKGNDELAAYCVQQSKHYRKLSSKLLKKVRK